MPTLSVHHSQTPEHQGIVITEDVFAFITKDNCLMEILLSICYTIIWRERWNCSKFKQWHLLKCHYCVCLCLVLSPAVSFELQFVLSIPRLPPLPSPPAVLTSPLFLTAFGDFFKGQSAKRLKETVHSTLTSLRPIRALSFSGVQSDEYCRCRTSSCTRINCKPKHERAAQ